MRDAAASSYTVAAFVGRELEAELEHVAAAFPLMVGEPLAPLFDVKAGEGGVVFVPFGDQLLEVQTKGARGCIGLSGNFLPDRRLLPDMHNTTRSAASDSIHYCRIEIFSRIESDAAAAV